MRRRQESEAARIDAQFMLVDAEDRLWVRRHAGGNTRFRIQDGRLEPASLPDEPRLSRATFITLTQTPGSEIWLGGMTTLERLQNGRFEPLGPENGLPEATPRARDTAPPARSSSDGGDDVIGLFPQA